MRILLLLLFVGVCLVSAKYIPHESSATNDVLHRIRRSDSGDTDSNAASVERNDNSSNDNDNNDDNDDDDDEDNDSSEQKLIQEQEKLREKEEKKKQKLLEKLRKERQKEIEEQRKVEEKLLKEQRKLQEKLEREERKERERIEKERRKFEEHERKLKEKAEKDERKRQEKLKKQLEEIQKDQIESAEDSYLETEEEDSVEIEDIWKAHVYNKYGLSITSTKLERQAALQQYLRDEMGIDSNSTKSERRQAIIKLIQTKLQNDPATVDAFRNLLLSHVNAVQMTKMRSKLEKDLEELDNQTTLLNNISLPWVQVAQQNIEEKRTFLQAVVQFLSNIVPNWLAGGQTSSNSTQTNSSIDNILSNNNIAGGINNTSVDIPAGFGQSSIRPSESNLPEALSSQDNNGAVSDISDNGAPLTGSISSPDASQIGSGQPLSTVTAPLPDTVVSQYDVNGIFSNAPPSVNSDSTNISIPTHPAQSSINPAQPTTSEDNIPINDNVAFNQNYASGVSTNDIISTNPESPNVTSSTGSEQTSTNLSQTNGSEDNGFVNSSPAAGQTDQQGISSSIAVSDNSGFATSDISQQSAAVNPVGYNASAVIDSSSLSDKPAIGQAHLNVLPNDAAVSSNSDSSNDALSSGLEPTSSDPSQPNIPDKDNSLASNVAIGENSTNMSSNNMADLSNLDLTSTISTIISERPSDSLHLNTLSDNGVLNGSTDINVNSPDNSNTSSGTISSVSEVYSDSNNNAVDVATSDGTSVSILPRTDAAVNVPTVGNNDMPVDPLNTVSSGNIPTNEQEKFEPVQSNDFTTGIAKGTMSVETTPIVADDSSSIAANFAPITTSEDVTNASTLKGNAAISSTEANASSNSTSVMNNGISTSDANITSVGNEGNVPVTGVISTSDGTNISNERNKAASTGSSTTENVGSSPTESAAAVDSGNSLGSSDVISTVQTVKETSIGIGSDSTIAASSLSIITSSPDNEVTRTTIYSVPVDISVPHESETIPENVASPQLSKSYNTDNVVDYVTGTSSSPIPVTANKVTASEVSTDSSVTVLPKSVTPNTEETRNTDSPSDSTVAVVLNASTASEPVTLSSVAVDLNTTSHKSSVSDAFVTSGATGENKFESQLTDSVNAPVVETLPSETPIEAESEQGAIVAQEPVNTPSDSVTVPSEVASVQTDVPADVTVPVEPGASIVGIQVQ